MTKTRLMVAAFAGLAIAAAASAQTDKMAPIGQGEATIYRDLNFQGPAVYVGEARENLGLAWPVRSIRVRIGLFCRSAGWNGSANESQESINGRVYLADVLCVRSGF